MILADWLREHDWTNLDLAKALGVTEECARLYRAGMRRPALPRDRGLHSFEVYAAAIMRITDGAVSKADLIMAYNSENKGSRSMANWVLFESAVNPGHLVLHNLDNVSVIADNPEGLGTMLLDTILVRGSIVELMPLLEYKTFLAFPAEDAD